ncbi:hypothetical protein [Duganella vulcania]|uniref:Uncharacterized protein n=1 Tax=Duganella vulcania TaxID=2692166 RepID=A0A845GS97_9BURK|nr:hypothetical protein [Duganella vulcania]MYM96545.1 hypothetical protein [Duganella vulcania]
MHNYDNDYFFLQKAEAEGFPSLTPDEATVERHYSFEIPSDDLSPFVFFNGARAYQIKTGVDPVKVPPEILFDGTSLVVKTAMRNTLADMNIPGFFMHPIIYTDDGQRYEDYWFLAFPDRFDCWDRELSDCSDTVIELGGFTLHSVHSYRLNSKILDDTPLQQRLLFKLGGTLDAFIVCHKSIVALFQGLSGAKIVGISDF